MLHDMNMIALISPGQHALCRAKAAMPVVPHDSDDSAMSTMSLSTPCCYVHVNESLGHDACHVP